MCRAIEIVDLAMALWKQKEIWDGDSGWYGEKQHNEERSR